MGIANRIVNILVLIAAIAAVVLGVMLFNKREDVTKSRELMAKAIADNTNALLKEEKQKVKVNASEMSVDKTSEQIVPTLKKFNDAAKKIIKQREEVAAYIVALTDIVSESKDMDSFTNSAPDIADYTKSNPKRTEIQERVQERANTHKLRREAFEENMRKVNALFQDAPMLSATEIDSAKITDNPDGISYIVTVFDEICEKIKKSTECNKTYAETLKKIAQILEKPVPALNDISTYQNDLQELSKNVSDYAEEYIRTRNERDDLKKENAELKGELEAANKKIDSLEATVKKQLAEIARQKVKIKELQDIINPPDTLDNGKDGNAVSNYEMLKQLQGKITYANPELGFVVISLGRINELEIKDAKGKLVKSKVHLPPNAIMTAASSLDPAQAAYTGKIQIVNPMGDHSVANILPSPDKTRMPKVGDVIFFSSFDLEAVKAENQKRLEEASRKSAAAQAAAPVSPVTAAPAAAGKEENLDDLLGSEKADGDKKPAKKEETKSEDNAEDEEASDDVL